MSEAVTLKGNAAVAFENTPQIPVVDEEPIYWLSLPTRDPYAFELHDDEILDFTKLEGMRYLFSKTASSTGKPLVLPEGFGQNATDLESCFNSTGFTSITLPDGFGQKATNLRSCFYLENRLKTLTIGEGFGQNATNLEYCFYLCTELEELILPKGFGQNAETLKGCFRTGERYQSKSSLKTLILPEGFGQKATNCFDCFSGCTMLQSLTLPEGFGQNATSLYRCFCGCDSITSLSLPNGFGQNTTDMFATFSCYNLRALVLPEGCGVKATTLRSLCSYCYELTDIYFPKGFGRESTDNAGLFGTVADKLTNITGNPNFKTSLALDKQPLLTVDSLMVIINGLQKVTTKQTLTLGETNITKLTEDQIKVATDKGWTVE